ncbi:MAG: hypothetical protein AB7I38_11410 [Dehalococcoidia bacterium]
MDPPRTITVTAMSRPHLFRQMLESLVANDLDGWTVLVRVEPGPRAAEFAPIAAELLRGVDCDLRVNSERRGITVNPFLTLEEAFARGSHLNLYLEEDFLVSPDATRLALWYARQRRDHWLCLSLLAGPCGSAGLLSNPAHPDLLFEARTFNSIGFVLRREEWLHHLRDVWLGRDGRAGGIHANWRYNWGWDWSVYGLLASNPELRGVQPVLARATHNGREGGIYALPAFHDAAFGGLPINDTPAPAYRVVEVAELPRDVRAHVVLQDELTTMRMQMEQVAVGDAEGQSTMLTTSLPRSTPLGRPADGGFWSRLRRRP